MKNITLALGFILAFAFGSYAQTTSPVAGGPEITFKKDVHDFGKVKQNGNATTEFVFTNTGTAPLIISNAKGSCGCTVPTWPKEPIMPGDSGTIQVKYSTNRVGRFTKQITLSTNVETKPLILTIKGEVLPAPKKDSLEKDTEGAPKE